ncbi:hypothetical protein [Acetobacter pasteurianus]|uniref:hypothetical protein n=1 Tax=Acetobacter pasteurianus TaxID=438 RepID=UPI0011DCEA85|nr:hypothetical protein [Acetobacter pasteurianus]
MLQGESSLAVTPATAASGATPATPAKLKPLLPLDETATVGDAGNTLGDAVSQAAGAVQAAGGDASKTITTPSGATQARTVADHVAARIGAQDFAGQTQTEQLVSAENMLGAANRPVQYFAPGTDLVADGAQTTIDANKTVIVGEDCTISGAGRRAVHSEILPPPEMFPANVKPRHLTQFYKACRSGKATVIVLSDSIYSPGANLTTMSESPFYTLCDEIMRQNPDVDFTFVNMGIGGQTYAGMASSGAVTTYMPWNDIPDGVSWLQACGDLNPDLVFIHSAGNDQWGFEPANFNTVYNFFKGLSTPPSLVYGIPYQPSLTSSVNDYHDDSIQRGMWWAATYVRSFCIVNDVGFVDELRWHAMCRDGIDPCDMSLTMVNLDGTTAPTAWENTVSTKNGWSFPDLKNDNGVSAAYCTDWRLAGTFPGSGTLPGVINVILSPGNKSQLWIIFDNDRNITAKYTDSTSSWTIPVTGVKAKTGDLQFALTCKNGRLQFLVLNAKSNTNWTFNDLGAKQLSLGYETVFDTEIVKFGGPYTPSLNTDTDSQMQVDGLWVSSSWDITENCRRYRPITNNNALYVSSVNAGGSDAYHMNTYGVRMILGHLLREVNWARNTEIVGDSLNVSGEVVSNGVTIGTQLLQKMGLSVSVNSTGQATYDYTQADGQPFQIQQYARLMSGAANTSVGLNGLIMQVGANGSLTWGSSITSFGGVGMYGKNPPSAAPTISGTKPTDPVIQGILSALVGIGVVKDGTA